MKQIGLHNFKTSILHSIMKKLRYKRVFRMKISSKIKMMNQ